MIYSRAEQAASFYSRQGGEEGFKDEKVGEDH
jgi:hypothetical protein